MLPTLQGGVGVLFNDVNDDKDGDSSRIEGSWSCDLLLELKELSLTKVATDTTITYMICPRG